MWPSCRFEHLGESFAPAVEVAADHPMVAARPDLFNADPPAKSTKKESK